MAKLQFRVLYREFLFRIVDLEVLSAQGHMSKLLVQFAALLAALSLMFSIGAWGFGDSQMTPATLSIATLGTEHFLIATTMLVVGLFAVLTWESTFPDRRDVLVLGPLPVRARTLFLAKVVALAIALSLTVLALNVFTGLTWPFVFVPFNGGVLGSIRSLVAYWMTMLAAGAFVFCCVLGVQGLAAQLLPRRRFLRLSAFLQLAAFCLLLSVYFLQPSLATPKALTAPQNQPLLAWLPSYWFLGLFEELKGSVHPAFVPLGRRALTGMAVAGFGAAGAFLLSYFRTLRKIAEEPDIVPSSRGANWSPPFGDSLQTAVVVFSVRTLLRSRQHRVILAFYWGIGFAIVLAYLKSLLAKGTSLLDVFASAPLSHVNVPLLASSVVMMCFAEVGVRVVFTLPLALRSNWIFRITAVRGTAEYLAATRRSLLVLAVAPVWAGSAMLFLSIWPLRQAAGHLLVLGLLGMILADLCLHGFQKIPFTCSYLPGKANVHVTSVAYMTVLVALTDVAVQFERRALQDPASYAAMLVVFGIVALWARRRTAALAESPETALQFEEAPAAEIFALELHRDGVLPT
jgi:hypothetical protein